MRHVPLAAIFAMFFVTSLIGWFAWDTWAEGDAVSIGYPPTPNPTREYCAGVYGEDDPVGMANCLGL